MKTWKDIDIFFRKQNDGDILTMYDTEAIKNSLYNILTTMQGSRRMLPQFALPLYNNVFEPIDEQSARRIANEMLKAITDWDDRIIVEKLRIEPITDQHIYNVSLNFRIKNYSEEQLNLNFILNAR